MALLRNEPVGSHAPARAKPCEAAGARISNAHPLPRPLTILDDGKEFLRLTTLADVRDFLGHIPKTCLQFDTWQCVKSELDKAAAGDDPKGVSLALQMVLMLENVECRSDLKV
jgi:hypothetical protein